MTEDFGAPISTTRDEQQGDRITSMHSTKKADRSNMFIIDMSDHGELLGDDGATHIYSLKEVI